MAAVPVAAVPVAVVPVLKAAVPILNEGSYTGRWQMAAAPNEAVPVVAGRPVPPRAPAGTGEGSISRGREKARRRIRGGDTNRSNDTPSIWQLLEPEFSRTLLLRI
jgi:hypothetical protein